MTQVLKQSTAADVLIGPMVDLTDGATAETGETPVVKLSKNGQTLAAKSDVTTPVHDADGYYNCELDATDTGTVGTLVLTVAASANALPVRHEYQVVEETTYDALFGASAAGFNASGQVTIGSVATGAITADAIAADAIGASELAADAVTEIQSGLATAAALATVDGNVDAILVDTGTTIPAQISALNDISAADVNAQVLDVLNTDTFAEPTGVPAATATLATKIGYLYMALRNQITITATKMTFFDDAGNAEWEKDLSDAGGTYTETEGNAI